jgi:hypothetical protein
MVPLTGFRRSRDSARGERSDRGDDRSKRSRRR